ncbi:ABC transporter ATP-binding protein [bacterium 1xD8-6]|jgi:ABC-type antimicrobial peptide transport system, ATPase component|nr:ABC transporter ATP-binding protein [bacterium D16-36]RKI63469.1 ABC transporter ATP-binding protein [bacterium 1xD8-6]
METIVKAEKLIKYYGTKENPVKAVDQIDLEIKRGLFTVIAGRSGSGKSTLLHLLGGLDRPDSGNVYIGEQNIFKLNGNDLAKFRRRKIGFVFQDFNLIPSLTVLENIILPLGLEGKTMEKHAAEKLLENIGLLDKKDMLPDTLSGGQKQRCAIARAIAAKPAIILADEPTGNLDSQTGLEIVTLLRQSVKEYGQTLVMITHDKSIARMADKAIVIKDGKVVGRT